jgi:putative PIN family toxin of toxin-antitoxin system
VGSSSPSEQRGRVVYDCNIYLQFLLSPWGPAGRFAFAGGAELFVSEAVLSELRELPAKSVAMRNGIDEETIARFIRTLLEHSVFVDPVAPQYEHPIDPDDSTYVNLALAAGANLIVSSDRHLLNLNNPSKRWADGFRAVSQVARRTGGRVPTGI